MADGASLHGIYHALHDPIAVYSRDGSTYSHPSRSLRRPQVNEHTGTIQIVGEFPNSRICCARDNTARVHTPTARITGATGPQAAVNHQQVKLSVTVVGTDTPRARPVLILCRAEI